MKRFVIDTNSLLQIIPKRSCYRHIWDDYLKGKFTLCVTTEILEEYEEILSANVSTIVANNIISVITTRKNTTFITPYFYFGLITADIDDNKFVDCAINSGASFIVTEDRHFDILSSIDFPKVDVISLDQYSKVMSNSSVSIQKNGIVK